LKTEIRFVVKLKYAKSISRVVALLGDHTLDDLHEIIYAAFDRYDEHLYSFYFPKQRVGRKDPPPKEFTSPHMLEDPGQFGIDEELFDASKTRLDSLGLKIGDTFEYLFDFGDKWMHELKVKSIGPVEQEQQYPAVIEKKGDSPPQYPDCDE